MFERSMFTACFTPSFFVCALFTLAGCSSGVDANTTGKRVQLHTALTADPATFSEFTTGFGWDVKLSKAAVASSAFYYFDGPPPTARLDPPKRSVSERLASLFVGTAWAHPGHYQAGTALGQALFTSPVTLDLFAPLPLTLPDGEGVTGTYRSARVVLPETPPANDALNGYVAIAEGKAEKHDGSSKAPIYFRLVADYDDISVSIVNGAVDGCVLDEVSVTDDGTVTVSVKPMIWLNLVDFSKIAASTAEAPVDAHDAGFSQGVTELSAYHFTYSQ